MLPIKTYRHGDKIAKVVVEDFYKVINRVYEAMYKAHNNSIDILESVHKTYNDGEDDYEGEIIIGTGVSQPCADDEFNEELGNEIAFKKAKLNANIKKLNYIRRVTSQYMKLINALDEEYKTLMELVLMDIDSIKKYNPDFSPEL